jgi:hypothetical protein
MSDIKTVRVVSKDPEYHKGQPFTINEEDFDSKKHRLFDSVKTDEAPDGLESLTVAELRKLADERGIELKGSLTKAAIIELLEPKQ